MAAGMISPRDVFREKLISRQDNICVVCGRGLYQDAVVHEAIIKRGDLPDDPRAFNEYNCVVLHNLCHENTRCVDCKAMQYLVSTYGIEEVFRWICSLNMIILPGRAMEIKNQQKQKQKQKQG